MNQVNEPTYLEDLKQFRWELYHHRKSREIVKCLSRYYFKKYYFEHFAEEIIISGYDLQNVSEFLSIEIFVIFLILKTGFKKLPSLFSYS